ncbi:hypothetical protein B0A50_07449 [Salinomyces thailandicus]|uniref:DNA polymerase V n=1 Tax=Salinomyces thailandicus TaxID=706561 RepID=A0A4U0TPF6_9PEZI|nr:hypothetical protein B0A50_07449 [Salinomyces thailandica]
MPGIKRSRAAEETAEAGGNIHPARKRRVQYGDEHVQLAKTYNDLSDEAPAVRLKAAGALLKTLSAESPAQLSLVDQAISRLVRGLCSGRRAARLGFSVALAEVLRLAFQLGHNEDAQECRLDAIVSKIEQLTQPEGRASGQEKREHLLGRRFASQAVLQSDIGLSDDVRETEWRVLLDSILSLAKQKDWLQTECGAILFEYLQSASGRRLRNERIQAMVTALKELKLLKTPEGVAIWLVIADQWPTTLPKDVWHKKDPLCSDGLLELRKVMQGSSVEESGEGANGKVVRPGTRQTKPSFAWNYILGNLYSRKEKVFRRFWEEVVDNGLFASSSSAERKAFGLQIVCLAVSTAPTSHLLHVLSKSIIRTIVNHRGENSRTLFEAAKLPLDQSVARAKQDFTVTAALLEPLITHGAFDQNTKSKTIEGLLQCADAKALQRTVSTVRFLILRPVSESDGQVEGRRRVLADLLLTAVRANRQHPKLFEDKGAPSVGLDDVLHALVEFGYCELADTPSPLSEASRSVFRSRMTSCLGLFMDQGPARAVSTSSLVLAKLRASRKTLGKPLGKAALEAIRAAEKHAQALERDEQSAAATQAYRLLLNLSVLQVYNDEPDSVEALNDLTASFNGKSAGGESTSMLIELLLSFVSKPSALFRKLAEQVFSAFAADMTPDGLQSLLDILDQKESLAGQQALFEDQQDSDASIDENSDAENGDDNGVDVDDMSDIELVNGERVDGSDAGSDGSSGSDSSSGAESDAGGPDGEDEEAVFDRKLADALGTAADEASDDDHGSDMDDEQMMALEPHLTNIFKERKKTANKKQEGKDAKESIVNFKNRVLDLLNIYVKTQYDQVLALDLILPLTMLVRTTTSKPTAEKAFAVLKQYFEACSKHKALPQLENEEACFEVLKAVHEEMKTGGSKLHANACSRSSLFLSKVLVALGPEHYKRIAIMYAELQSQWYLDAQSKVQGSVFTEWTSWSLTTRKLQTLK